MSELEKVLSESSITFRTMHHKIEAGNKDTEARQKEFFFYSVQKMSRLVEHQFTRMRLRSVR